MSDLVHHEPLQRSPDVVAFEIVMTIGQAYLVGVCVVLAVEDGQAGLTAVLLGFLGLGAAAGYGLWLFGGPGTLMAVINVPLLLLSLFALLSSFQPDTIGLAGRIVRSDGLGLALQLMAVAASALGIIGGLFLPGPRRRRWHQARSSTPAVRVAREPWVDNLAGRMRASIRRPRKHQEVNGVNSVNGNEEALPSEPHTADDAIGTGEEVTHGPPPR